MFFGDGLKKLQKLGPEVHRIAVTYDNELILGTLHIDRIRGREGDTAVFELLKL